ncbi:MAG TPA: hypothetical protein VMU03_02640 [Gammaproteobacteria bacterium]|nr:hypothetical protein [Gammaproteobacteria bacterium]
MQPESLEVLEKAEVAPAQARAIVRAIEIEIAGAEDTLATKHDLVLLRRDIREEIGGLRGEVGELRGEFFKLRGEFSNLRGEFAELRAEFSELRAELKGDMVKLEARLEAKIHESTSNIARQMYTAVLGQMAVLLGFAYFFATHVR